MAFISAATSILVAPICMGRRGGNTSRTRQKRSRSVRHRTPPARMDPIVDDGEIDTTDIKTYVSCPICFNSIMLRPERLASGPLRVRCNCCERDTMAALQLLENMDGSPFDVDAWCKMSITPMKDGFDDVESEEKRIN